jgi:hypothetical protein
MLNKVMMPPAGGFMPAALPMGVGSALPISRSVFKSGLPAELQEKFLKLERGEFGDVDPTRYLADLQMEMLQIMRSGQTLSGVPIRENLEAEAKQLTPLDTPLRNRLPRMMGSSSASSWEQMTSLGGGYGVNTTVTSGASSATQTVGSTSGMVAGMSLYFQTSNVYAIISSVTNSTTVVLTSSISSTTDETVQMGPYAQPGQNPVQAFFSESGAPATSSAVYAKKTATYKLLGTMLSITGLAMAAGASYDNQLALEKTAAIRRLMLIEEFALINSVSTIIEPPFGDGTNALGFDGLLALITSANGVPVPQIQTSVGTLTTAHIDSQLTRTYTQGAMNAWIMVNGQEALSLTHLAESAGTIIRQTTTNAESVLGFKVTGYKHPITGEEVPILVSRFMPAGTIVYGADFLPDAKAALDVDVLPQVQLPEIAPNVNIQGYVAQEIAPSVASPHVYPGIVSVYEVLRMKGATVFGKSTGVTSV